MPDKNNPNQEPKQKRQFIREKVVKPPMTRRQIAGRLCALVLIAGIGGAAAGVSFAVARPLAQKYLVPEETTESIPVTIPKDEPETTPPETTVPETTEPVTEDETDETEPVEDLIQAAIESYEHDTEDLTSMYGALRKVAAEAEKGVVIVHSVKQEVDWFDNPVETSGLYAGVVIASTRQELLILTLDSAVEKADSIKVTFADGSEADGIIKQTDTVSGMAIVSVETQALSDSTRNNVTALTLGNSYSVKQGDVVFALGAPAGFVRSSTYGSISYVMRNVQVADGITRLLFADIDGSAEKGTFLFNITGELIGWMTDAYQKELSTNQAVVMAISDYKAILEKMSNGVAVPYLGIRGQEVSAAMASSGLPMGVYVAECILNGPAYNAGIQNGDVIVKVGDKPISTIKDYQNQLDTLNRDEEVTVVVQRKGIDEYKELEYQVTVGAR